MIDYHVSVTEKSIESYKVVQVGDFIISLRSFQGGIEYSQYHGICSPAYVVLRRRGEGSDAYFRHYLKTDRFIQILTKNLEGLRDGKMISYKQFSELRLPVPSPTEQQKIADCLSSLDELIAALARKVDAFKTHKKGLMQQLFPREGETQPRLRFPEFRGTEEWSESKLINLSTEPLSNGVFNDPKRVGSGYKLINVSDMYIETSVDESQLTLLELSSSEFAANQVRSGDIFFTRSSLVKSGIAVSNIYLGTSDDVTYDGHLIRFRPNTSKVVPLFAHYLFKTAPIREQLIARGKTATMTTIGQTDVASVTLSYPNVVEQKRIADCLTSLDTLITAATQELDTLKTHKKGRMQQLFPSPEAVEA
jgi:type I restriction enzyme S subunit